MVSLFGWSSQREFFLYQVPFLPLNLGNVSLLIDLYSRKFRCQLIRTQLGPFLGRQFSHLESKHLIVK